MRYLPQEADIALVQAKAQFDLAAQVQQHSCTLHHHTSSTTVHCTDQQLGTLKVKQFLQQLLDITTTSYRHYL